MQKNSSNNKYIYLLPFFCASFIFLTPKNTIAQLRHWDTITHYVNTVKPSFAVELDGRHSFFREMPVVIDGIRVGLNYGNRVRFYIGGYWNRHKVSRTFTLNKYTPSEQRVRQDLSMFYISATAEYVFYNTQHWELATPVQIGIGQGKRTRYDVASGRQIEQLRPAFIPFELGFKATYHITEWLNVSAGIGYRYALFSKTVSDDFSAMYYTYGIGISPIKILKKAGVLEEKNGKLRLKQ